MSRTVLAVLVALSFAAPAAAASAAPAPAVEGGTTPVMVVLDASGSMKQADAPGPRIDAAKKAVTELVRVLPDDAQVGLTAYGMGTGSSDTEKARGCKDITQLVPVDRLDRAAFGRAVAGLRASGYTPIGESLRAAAKALPAEGPRSIVLVSDGEDTCAPPAPCEVARQLKASGVDLVVHTIGFKVAEAARRQLACIASATGGSYREATSGAALGAELTSRVSRAIRPYGAVGRPIRGGDTVATAPEIKPGQYLDTYARGGRSAGDEGTEKFYAVRLAPGDTPHFSATLAPVPIRSETTDALVIRLAVVDAEGDSCGPTNGGGVDIAVFGKVVAQTAVLDPPPVGDKPWNESCSGGDGPVYLRVTRAGDAFRTEQLPVELAFRLEPAVVDPGPPAATERSAPLPAPAVGAARPVEGGTSFNDAPVLTPGSFTDSITTGETRYFRVPLGWGQRLAYRVSVPAQGLPIQTAALYVRLASPLRADAGQQSGNLGTLLLGGKDDQEVSGSTAAPVRYANRDAKRLELRPYQVDGYYYVVLDLSYRLGRREPVSFPFTLTVATSGGEQGPTYQTDPAAYGGTASPSPSASPAAASSPAPESGTPGWVPAALAVVAVVVAALVAIPLWRRRVS
jgi:Ca-activated chloride channel homolog